MQIQGLVQISERVFMMFTSSWVQITRNLIFDRLLQLSIKIQELEQSAPLNITKGRVKKSDFYHLGGEGWSARVNCHFLLFHFFVPNVLKIIFRHKSFSSIGSLANIKCGAAAILNDIASISSNEPDILHVQHHFLGFSKGKMH